MHSVSESPVRIKFWGTRGSIAVPGPDTLHYGGNTSCVELRADGEIIVLDAGSGIRHLGIALQKEFQTRPINLSLLITHAHWDHIQGFPFFDPAFVPGNIIHLYGGNNVSRTLEETLAGQMDHPSFPVHLTDMGAKMTFNDLAEGQVLQIDDVKISTARGNHPNGVWLYRIEHAGKSIVYATDTEHYKEVDAGLLKLAQGVDVLIYDSQYTPEEYTGTAGTGGPKVGWGHSTFEEAVKLATAAKVKKLVLFHHDPLQSDAQVRAKEKRAQGIFKNALAAYEGLVIDV